MFRHIIWDFDGSLFDTYPAFGRAFAAAMADLGKPIEARYAERLARESMSHCAATLATEGDLEEQQVLEAFGRHYADVPPAAQPPFAGARRLCNEVIAGGGRNFIVTHRGRRSTRQLLEAYGMGSLFTEAVTGDDSFPRKPDPAAFRYLLHRYQLAPQDVLAIGDRDLDILAGREAGIVTCRFGTAVCPVGADLAVVSLEELFPYLTTEDQEEQ